MSSLSQRPEVFSQRPNDTLPGTLMSEGAIRDTMCRKKIIIESDSESDEEFKTVSKTCCIPSCKNLKSKIGNKSFCKKHNKKYKFDKPIDCPICLERLDDKYPLLNCGHWVHHKCVIESGKSECPMCRAGVTFNRDLKKEMNKKIKIKKTENEREEMEELRRMQEEEEREYSRLYYSFKEIFESGLIDEGLDTIISFNQEQVIIDIDMYTLSEYRKFVVRDLRKLSRHRLKEVSNSAKALLEMLDFTDELIGFLFKIQIEDVRQQIISMIIKNEFKAYEFVKRQLFTLNY